MSSYFEAQFCPRAARPGEVTLLILNIMNLTETLPVHVKKEDLFPLYCQLFGEPADQQQAATPQGAGVFGSSTSLGRCNQDIHDQW